jgi:GT2 family glycosyltransferase
MLRILGGQMYTVAIVILNYLNYKDTIECIESIKCDKYEKKEIIVVDNNSNNESWNILNEQYMRKIHLIKSEENVGFARGNNLGIEYARKILKCSFVLLVNNDTIFKDNMLITELMKSYELGVAVIGPRIISSDGVEQNPVQISLEKSQVQDIYNNLTICKKRNIIKDNMIYLQLKKMKFLRYIKKRIDNNGRIKRNIISESLVLQGACMMLTKDYFRYYTKLFPGTFLYYEENILTLITRKLGLNKKFINNVWIYHKEDQSSLMSFNNLNDIKQKYELESMKKCLELFDLPYEEIVRKYFMDNK